MGIRPIAAIGCPGMLVPAFEPLPVGHQGPSEQPSEVPVSYQYDALLTSAQTNESLPHLAHHPLNGIVRL